MKKFLKVVSIVMAFTLFVQILPMSTLAEAITAASANQATESTDVVKTEEPGKKDALILGECENLRTEDTKYFRCDDGSFIAAKYSTPVHYKENGVWKDIDNSLSDIAVEKDGSSKEGNDYKTCKGENTISVPKQLGENKWITLSKSGYTVKFGIKQGTYSESLAQIKKSSKETNLEESKSATETTVSEKNNEKLALPNLNSSVTYPNAFENTDLQYNISPTGIKENILINEKQDKYEYTFVMDFDGLTPVLNKDGTISLFATDRPDDAIFKIEAPYMFDANDETSTKVEMKLEQNGKLYELNLVADSEWINASDRKFPVTIDPTMTLDLASTQIHDTYVDTSNSGHNFYLDNYLYAGNNSLGLTRTYIKFDLPALPTCSIICDAQLGLLQYDVDLGSGATVYANVYDCSSVSSWASNTITWDNQPMPKTPSGMSSKTVLDYSVFRNNSGNNWYLWNITKAAKSWYNNGGVNNGVMIASSDETATKRARFYSSEYPDSQNALYPKVIVTYRDNKGLEPYWTYHTVSAGTAGTAYVNDYTGNLVFSHNDVSTSGKLMPIGINHVYNGYMAGVKYTEMKPYVGHGWKMSIEQTIRPSSDFGLTGDAATTYPYWTALKKVDSKNMISYV